MQNGVNYVEKNMSIIFEKKTIYSEFITKERRKTR